MKKSTASPTPDTLGTIRTILIAIFAFTALGTGAELMLLEHTETAWELVPVLLTAAGMAVLAWMLIRPTRVSLRAFQLMMALFIVSGFLGVILHYRVNVEFEVEMYPTRVGPQLFWEALKGATPALAPGVMIGIGLLGLTYSYQHPSLTLMTSDDRTKTE